jgi:hypothetical protein
MNRVIEKNRQHCRAPQAVELRNPFHVSYRRNVPSETAHSGAGALQTPKDMLDWLAVGP